MNEAAQIQELDELARGTVTVETRGELAQKLARSRQTGAPLRVKLGVDPTSSDLHLGHAVVLRKMRQFQDRGHQGVLIIGDYTACVGDPSGRNKTRPQLTHAEVRSHAETYLAQAYHVLDRARTEVRYNGDWFRKLEFLDVVRMAARITVARMLEREDFARRYGSEQPISLHEFLYPLMQAHDSVEVCADVELGGTDQTFNLLLGRDLMRQEGLEPQVCMTLPLLVGTDGEQKMSKSYGNFIGLGDAPEEMFGKTMSVPDAAMRSYYTLGTRFSLDEIESILAADDPRAAKATLARALVELYHGAEAARAAEQHFDRVFRDRQDPEDMPSLALARADLDPEGCMWVIELLTRAGLASSNNDARRKVEGGGVRLNGARIDDPAARVSIQGGQVLRVGKKHFRRLVLEAVE